MTLQNPQGEEPKGVASLPPPSTSGGEGRRDATTAELEITQLRRFSFQGFDLRPSSSSPAEQSVHGDSADERQLTQSEVASLLPPAVEISTAKPAALPPIPIKLETTGLSSHRQLQFRSLTAAALAATMVAKLRSAGFPVIAQTIEDCGTQDIYLVCKGCSVTRIVHNHCDNHICPKCQPKLARNRYEEIKFWAGQISQPKHVVLTIKNQPWIDADAIRGLSQCFARLRRRKFAKAWNGGMWSIEITNEGAGWHIHLHALIDAKWIDARELAIQWAQIVGQQFAIVKVKDARAADYVKECAKYCVKGSDLAKWEVDQLKEFVEAIEKCRTFGTFGSLFKRRSKLKEYLDAMMNERRACECGCADFRCLTKDEYDAQFCTYIPPPTPRPVHVPESQLSLI